MLAEKRIEIDGTVYTVREPRMRDVLAIFEGPENDRAVGLMKVSVYNGGADPLGDAVLDLGFRAYNQLQSAVAEVYGLTGADLGNVP
jgi:hypothetical protein